MPVSGLCSLTAVGYGRRFPVASSGRAVAMITATVGAFYLAMPLSIVGTKFYDIYGHLKEVMTKKTRKLKKLVLRARAFKRDGTRPRYDLFSQYKDDLEGFCNMKTLSSVDTVDLASVAEVQVRKYVGKCTRLMRILEANDTFREARHAAAWRIHPPRAHII